MDDTPKERCACLTNLRTRLAEQESQLKARLMDLNGKLELNEAKYDALIKEQTILLKQREQMLRQRERATEIGWWLSTLYACGATACLIVVALPLNLLYVISGVCTVLSWSQRKHFGRSMFLHAIGICSGMTPLIVAGYWPVPILTIVVGLVILFAIRRPSPNVQAGGPTKLIFVSLLFLLPRAQRKDIEADLRDDIRDMRRAKYGTWRIRGYVIWQFTWAVIRLYGAKLLKIFGAFALMDKLKH